MSFVEYVVFTMTNKKIQQKRYNLNIAKKKFGPNQTQDLKKILAFGVKRCQGPFYCDAKLYITQGSDTKSTLI